jgi:hypothetical protein
MRSRLVIVAVFVTFTALSACRDKEARRQPPAAAAGDRSASPSAPPMTGVSQPGNTASSTDRPHEKNSDLLPAMK